jgi:hypothetical protein
MGSWGTDIAALTRIAAPMRPREGGVPERWFTCGEIGYCSRKAWRPCGGPGGRTRTAALRWSRCPPIMRLTAIRGSRMRIFDRRLIEAARHQSVRTWGSISGEFIVAVGDNTPWSTLESCHYWGAKVGQCSYYSCYCSYS